jgi:DMSO/TMAO reductase YedYZ heme-binding membrane subunit
MALPLAAGPSPLWYLTRATGAVALLLLTGSVVLGILGAVRFGSPRWPRFLTAGLHRNLSLLVLALLAVHVLTAVLDSFAPIALKDAVVPFVSAYRPFWLGLGAFAFDLLLALTATSLLRRRLGYRTWRAVHWLAYASWPLALVHALGTGSDARLPWLLAVAAACLAAVVVALWWRLAAGWPSLAGVRLTGLAASVAVPLVVVLWYTGGPGHAGWARRAGTPARLLASSQPVRNAVAAHVSGRSRARRRTQSPAATLPAVPFASGLRGSLRESRPNSQGRVAVEIDATLGGGGLLTLLLDGLPLPGGGVAMDTSQVSLGTPTRPRLYTGRIVALEGERLVAVVSGSRSLQLAIDLQVDRAARTVSGVVHASALPGGTSRSGDGDGEGEGGSG